MSLNLNIASTEKETFDSIKNSVDNDVKLLYWTSGIPWKKGKIIKYDDEMSSYFTQFISNWFINIYLDVALVKFSPIVKNMENEEKIRLNDIIEKCTHEMVKYIISDVCKGYIHEHNLKALALSCFIISVKLIGAHDLDIEDPYELTRKLIGLTQEEYPQKYIDTMEIDILKRTDWQGCKGTIGLNKIYNGGKHKRTKRTKSKKNKKRFSTKKHYK